MCTNCVPSINEQQTEAFGQRLTELLNSAGLSMMISMGHRTALFDTMSRMQPSTRRQIASAADLDERYVREWLGAMVTGRIVEYDPANQTYKLPAEHAALLTRDTNVENFAATMQWIAVLGRVESDIVDCFHRGGGVHYAAFERFHEVMAEESDASVVNALSDHILPLVPEVEQHLNLGIDVADIGCGSGRALIALAEKFPNSSFAGFDFSEEAIDRANADAQRRKLTNVTFEVKDVADLGLTDRIDMMTAFAGNF